MNETLTTETGHSVLCMDHRFAHPVDKVWRALTDPAELGHWFPSKVELDLAPGGKVRFLDLSPDYPVMEGEITELDPPRLLAYTWGDEDHLRWELRPDGDGCLLTLTHMFLDRYGAASFASGWTGCLEVLALRLDGKLAGSDNPDGLSLNELPQGLAGWADLHEAFVARFGLDEPTVRRTEEGWVVRFERQLVQPARKVWKRLAGGNEPVVGQHPPAGFTTDALPAGPVVAVDRPALLVYRWPAAADAPGRVRWELLPGHGGAHLVLTHTIPTALADHRPTAIEAWRTHIEDLAGRLKP